MTLSELMVEQTARARDEANEARLRFAAEAVAERRHRIRERIAGMLARLGMWFDRAAVERASGTAPRRPQGRALWD